MGAGRPGRGPGVADRYLHLCGGPTEWAFRSGAGARHPGPAGSAFAPGAFLVAATLDLWHF